MQLSTYTCPRSSRSICISGRRLIDTGTGMHTYTYYTYTYIVAREH